MKSLSHGKKEADRSLLLGPAEGSARSLFPIRKSGEKEFRPEYRKMNCPEGDQKQLREYQFLKGPSIPILKRARIS